MSKIIFMTFLLMAVAITGTITLSMAALGHHWTVLSGLTGLTLLFMFQAFSLERELDQAVHTEPPTRMRVVFNSNKEDCIHITVGLTNDWLHNHNAIKNAVEQAVGVYPHDTWDAYYENDGSWETSSEI